MCLVSSIRGQVPTATSPSNRTSTTSPPPPARDKPRACLDISTDQRLWDFEADSHVRWRMVVTKRLALGPVATGNDPRGDLMSTKSVMTGLAAAAAVLVAPLATTPAHAQTPPEVGITASGCNHQVCLYTAYTGSGYEAWAEFTVNVAKGHIDFHGPGLRASSPDGPWKARVDTRRYAGRGSGTVCAEGWSYYSGRWHSIGLPCVTV